MRNTLIASSVAALALAGLAGGAVYAADSDASPEVASTTTVPEMDILADIGLTLEQGACLVENVGGVDMEDRTAMMDLLTECGVSAEQLPDIGQSAVTTESGDTTETPPTPPEVPPVELDARTASAMLALLGLDQAAVACMVAEAETAAPTDDASAEAVFIACEVGPLQILEAIVALDEASGDATAVPVDTAAAVDLPVVTVGPTGSIESSENAARRDLLRLPRNVRDHHRRRATAVPCRERIRS